MKEIFIMTSVTVNVTDEEYEIFRDLAYDGRRLDNPYSDIKAPDWIMKRAKENGILDNDGWISDSSFYRPVMYKISNIDEDFEEEEDE